MQKKQSVIQRYNRVIASFASNSSLYALSLDKRHSVLDYKKFIDDPWPGDIHRGKNILNGIVSFNYYTFEVNIIDIITQKIKVPNALMLYINSFAWIRDVQSVGGVVARRYVRNIVSYFIDNYKHTKKFWMNLAWNTDVASERIINWMTSYSFFAIGSDDIFQREVLSSITEQHSHISKIYKAETDSMVRLVAMKAMLFYFESMKNNQERFAKNLITKISHIVIENIDKYGMHKTRNPLTLFNVFRSLIEIRFIIKNMEIGVSNDIFKEFLCKMASVVRFFRMGNGMLSSHPGDSISRTNFLFQESRRMIDTALSIIDINYQFDDNKKSICGFDKISTKKSMIILNKMASNVRYQFNPKFEPGINIFDFEASLQSCCLIRRSDIAIFSNNHMIKANKNIKPNVSISKDEKNITYVCEAVNVDKNFQFVVRREISIGVFTTNLSIVDFVYTSADSDVSLRLAFDKEVVIEKINSYSFLIKHGIHSYIFLLNRANIVESLFSIKVIKNTMCSMIIILFKNKINTENQVMYSIFLQ